jgi:hypothetical protein
MVKADSMNAGRQIHQGPFYRADRAAYVADTAGVARELLNP